MAQQTISIGSTANDGTGDSLRVAFNKINSMFTELYGETAADSQVTIAGNSISTNDTNADLVLSGSGTGGVVASAIRLSGTTISSDDSTVININEGLIVDGTTNISGAITADSTLSVLGAVTVNNSVTANNLTTNTITSNGSNADVSIQPSGTGDVIISSLRINGTTLDSSDSTKVTIAEAVDVSGALNAGSTMAITGATTLSSTLAVTGTSTFSDGVTAESIITNSVTSNGSNADLNLQASGTGSVNISALNFNGTEISSSDSSQVTIKENLHVTGNITGTLTGSVAFSNVTGTPTTISGYGITDAASSSATALTVVGDDSSGTGITIGETFKIAGGSGITTAVSGDTITITNTDGGDASTGDITFIGSTLQSPSNADITLDPAGTGIVRMNTDNIALGASAGTTSQGTESVAIGKQAGTTSQGDGSVAIGAQAGTTSQGAESVAIGDDAGTTSQGQRAVAIGRDAGNDTQAEYAVAVGSEAGEITQGENSVAIGRQAGYDQGNNAVHVGSFAGGGTGGGPGTGSIGIGKSAGVNSQSTYAIAVGFEAGVTNQGNSSVAVGYRAGNNGLTANSIAIGVEAGKTGSGSEYTTAIGYQAAFSGGSGSDRSIAIGFKAGYTSLAANSIVLNAHNGELNTVGSSRFYVKPVRSASGNSQPLLRYEASSGEISYMPHIETNDNTIAAVQTNATLILTGNGTGGVTAENLTINDNTISSPSNSDISIQPGGTGNVLIGAVKINGTTFSSDDSSKISIAEAVDVNGNLVVTGSQIDFTNLPTSDPGTAGRLYRDGATVKVSI